MAKLSILILLLLLITMPSAQGKNSVEKLYFTYLKTVLDDSLLIESHNIVSRENHNSDYNLEMMRNNRLSEQKSKKSKAQLISQISQPDLILSFVGLLEQEKDYILELLKPSLSSLLLQLEDSVEHHQIARKKIKQIIEDEDGVSWEYRSVLKQEEIKGYFQKILQPEKKHANQEHVMTIDETRYSTFAKHLDLRIVREYEFEWKRLNGESYLVKALDVNFQSTKDFILYKHAYFQEIESVYEVWRRKVSGFGGPWERVGDKLVETTKILHTLGWDGKHLREVEPEGMNFPGQDTPDKIVDGEDGYFYITRMINKQIQNQFVMEDGLTVRMPGSQIPLHVLTEHVNELVDLVVDVEFLEDRCEAFNQDYVCRMILDVWNTQPLEIRSKNYFQTVFRKYVTFRKPYYYGGWKKMGELERTRDELMFTGSYSFKYQPGNL